MLDVEEALYRPRENTSISQIADTSTSKLQRRVVPEATKSYTRVRVRSQAFRAIQPIRKTVPFTTPPQPSLRILMMCCEWHCLSDGLICSEGLRAIQPIR